MSGSECGMSVCSEGGPEQEPLGSRSSLEAGSETESDTNSERRAAGSRWETTHCCGGQCCGAGRSRLKSSGLLLCDLGVLLVWQSCDNS